MEDAVLRLAFGDAPRFVRAFSDLRLRKYQEEVARAVVDSVKNRRGLSFVVIFPRQSGKNELQAQIEAHLLALFHQSAGEMVKVSPTWKPQALNAMRRLERVLQGNRLLKGKWRKEQGFIYRLGGARIYFLSGAATSNVVGATASLLLECDEAQDVSQVKWDKEINPMAASSNATRVFWGTAWNADTLLGRELRLARQQEQGDGVRRVFTLSAEEVRGEVPAYGAFVDGEIARLGRDHPLVRTQYFCEELDGEGGMFPAGRRALTRGEHTRRDAPQMGKAYAFLLDVAGADENAGSGLQAAPESDAERDLTALTIVEIDESASPELMYAGPCYRVVKRQTWRGTGQPRLFAELRALVELWGPRRLVIDATGLGAGLAGFLSQAFGRMVKPFIFTSKSKSELGWKFIALIETGRFKDYADDDDLGWEFRRQMEHCQIEALPGPGHLIRWGTANGSGVHDDLLVSAALCAALDETPGSGESVVIAPLDPLEAGFL